MLGSARTTGVHRRKKTKSLDTPSFLSIRNLSKQQARCPPALFAGDPLSHTESQIISCSSPSKPASRLQTSQNVSSVRTVSEFMNKSYSHRSISISARKPTVEYMQTYDLRSVIQRNDSELTPGDLRSIEAAKAKHKEMLARSKDVAVTDTQRLVANQGEFVLLSEILTAFESVENTYLHEKCLTLTKALVLWHDSLQAQLHTLTEKSQQIDDTVLQAKMLTAKNDELAAKAEQSQRKKKDAECHFEKHSREWQGEKAKYEDHITVLSQELAKLQGEGSLGTMTTKLMEQQKYIADLAKEFRSYKDTEAAKKFKLVQELGAIREQMNEKRDGFAQFEREKTNFEELIRAKDEEIQLFQDKTTQQSEALSMMSEEISRLGEYKYQFERLTTLHEELKRSMNTLESDIKSGHFNTFRGEMVVSLDDPLFQSVHLHPSQEQNMRKSNTKTRIQRPESPDDSLVDLTRFYYQRPSFSALIHESIPDATQAAYDPPFSNWLELTIRGIFDSKYYETLLCTEESGRKVTRFPDFVYAWMGNFAVDDCSRQVKPIEKWQRSHCDRLRLMLLLGVRHELSKRVWEISTFKEFLYEEMGSDELTFYLHCRFLLFSGPQLSTADFRFDHFQYVLLAQAKAVVDCVMEKLPEKLKSDVRSLMSQHAKKRGNDLQIEASLVLRVLLEYYRKEKQVKYKAIKQLFEASKASSTTGGEFTFGGFRSVVSNLNWDLTEGELAGFYRDCWTAGCGLIDHDVFFLVANESHIFQRSLRLKSMTKPPPLDSEDRISKREGPIAELMSRIFDSYESFSSSLSILKDGISMMGQPDIAHYIVKIDNYIRKKGQLPPEDHSGWSVYDAFRHLCLLVLRLNLAFEEHNPDLKPLISPAEDFCNTASGTL